jgi:hypothetical protein
MDKKLREVSAAIAALNGAHIATIDRVQVGTPVYSFLGKKWCSIVHIDPEHKYPLQTITEKYTEEGKFYRGDLYNSLFLIDPINGTLPPETEIDWSKVDAWVDVIVMGRLNAKFISYSSWSATCWYHVCGWERPQNTARINIKLAPHVDIKPEWLKK